MVERAKMSKRRYMFTFFIIAIIFAFGFLLGFWAEDQKLDYLASATEDLKMDSLNFDVLEHLSTFASCDNFPEGFLNADLDKLENDLQAIEKGSNDPNGERLLYLKGYYSLLELKHWELLSYLNDRCDKDYKFVFFFYINSEEVCSDCITQGFILEKLRDKYDNVKVYSFDSRVEVPAVEVLRGIYGVDQYPFTIVDGEVYKGFVDFDTLDNQISEV